MSVFPVSAIRKVVVALVLTVAGVAVQVALAASVNAVCATKPEA